MIKYFDNRFWKFKLILTVMFALPLILFGQGQPVLVKNPNSSPVPVDIVSGGGGTNAQPPYAVSNALNDVLAVHEHGVSTNAILGGLIGNTNFPALYTNTYNGTQSNFVVNLPSIYTNTYSGVQTSVVSNLPTIFTNTYSGTQTSAITGTVNVREQGLLTNTYNGIQTNFVNNLPSVYTNTYSGTQTSFVSNIPSVFTNLYSGTQTSAITGTVNVREQGIITNIYSGTQTSAITGTVNVREQGLLTNTYNGIQTNAVTGVVSTAESGIITNKYNGTQSNIVVTSTIDGADTFFVLPLAASNSTNIIKTSAGTLYGIRAGNLSSTPYVIQLRDSTSQIVSVGTNFAMFVVPALAAGANCFQDFNPIGAKFTNGLAFAVSGQATNFSTIQGGPIFIYYK